ncbi:MAG TPA: response regulator [Gemmatimonadales bacterium]|nr:response regulator [Gemmatimonadales bacterium]
MLPLLDTESASATGTGAHASGTGAQGTILLVDDDDAVRSVIARYLVTLGYVVIEAGDAVHALYLTTSESPVDLVLSDIVLPGLRGPALLHELRGRWPSVKTLLMTGFAEEALQPEDWPSGTGFLSKPFTIEELRLVLARAIGPGTNLLPCPTHAAEERPQSPCSRDAATGRIAS